ncbi:unnamed protein product [Urochloa decumbens]|uniref:Fe2OG dioxygenase domain-containing protein n=1 Tax=Urochloa decumbens TaxID=240449 RepID=A0ABC8YEB7_9POAL
MASPSPPASRAALLKAFDESRTGVRGLVETGVSSVPDIFLHPDPYASAPLAPQGVSIPICVPSPAAARDWGFFHLVNYSHLHPSLCDDYPARALAAVRAFNELPGPERAKRYGRAPVNGGVSYSSNVDLFRSPSASWRDTMELENADPARIPAACRAELLDWDAVATAVGRVLLRLLSQGLGLPDTTLEEASCLDGKVMVCHYYPVCPEPERTIGIVAHTDPGVLVVLAQDGVGGLQVRHAGGEDDGKGRWVDVKPVPGALVVNVGDLLQMMSNDEYKSVEHRVVMNTREEARVSIALFFNPGKSGESDFYGPLPELVSKENPAKYRNFTIPEFLETFFSRELASKVLLEHFIV